MDAPVEELKRFMELYEQSTRLLEQGRADDAETAAREALLLDEKNPKAYELLACIMERKGDEVQAETLRARAAAMRKEAWRRQVEAEIRGRHEMIGEPTRHERY